MRDLFVNLFKNPIFIILIGVALVLPFFISWIISLDSFMWFEMSTSNDWIGFLGSYVGGILGGMLTLLGVLITIKKQDEQASRLEVFQFDNSFFKLISLHNDLVRNLIISIDVEEEVKGNSVFNWLSEQMRSNFEEIIHEDYLKYNLKKDIRIEYKVAKIAYEEVYFKYEGAITHYIRNLLYLLKLISELKDKGLRTKYIDILRAQLSQSELVFLFYYGLSPIGKKEFLSLAIEQNLFNESDRNLLINDTHLEFYRNRGKFDEDIDDISLFLDNEDIKFPEDD